MAKLLNDLTLKKKTNSLDRQANGGACVGLRSKWIAASPI